MTTAEGYINEVLRSMPAATPQRSQIALELRGHIAERWLPVSRLTKSSASSAVRSRWPSRT